jgi:S-adenosylmethionine uptake transporter
MNNYFTGICWFLLSLLTSSINDLAAKFLGQNLPFEIVAFHRFFFGTLTLVPFIFLKGSKEFHTTRPYLHIIRGSILYGTNCNCYSRYFHHPIISVDFGANIFA